MKYLKGLRPTPSLIVSIIALVIACAGGAYAAATITGSDIKNNSLKSNEVKNKTLKKKDLQQEAAQAAHGQAALTVPTEPMVPTVPMARTVPTVPPVPTAQTVPMAQTALNGDRPRIPSGAQIVRNNDGSPTGGSSADGARSEPPLGDEITEARVERSGTATHGIAANDDGTASGTEKASFGKWSTSPVIRERHQPGSVIRVLTTGEDNAGPGNPNMHAEDRDPSGLANEVTPSMVYVQHPLSRTRASGSHERRRTQSGETPVAGFYQRRCGHRHWLRARTRRGDFCTLAQAKTALVANNDGGCACGRSDRSRVGKGRDYAYQAHSDALRINNTVYDFEPEGVNVTTP